MLGLFFKPKARPNRRYSPRKKTRNLVLLSIPAEECMMNLVDLSESGAQLSSPKPLRKNRVIQLKINLAEQNREVLLKGKVVWTRMTASRSHIYRIGVTFIEISQDAWMKLHAYMSQSPAASLPAA